ncbi:WW domain binding protein 11-domain-containing protein [Stachybotrys elegans]|uniref:WW domain binding protein 11-domain-containing protein n=1 Tax=Stachybotrys elegans TaxID=80388 RepID=A0A8K0SFJ4_9HYPO|nr:WW domain binding protein 11-domain-containing protein [Stachybotrys elegans]
MPKEKNYNPVQAQRKADKARAIKKGKADLQDRRNEKLALKNPDRIQKQIDDLKAITTSGGKLTRHEEQTLDGLEKELKAVKRARESLGDKAPSFGRSWNRDHDGRGGVLGKRRRGSHDGSSSDEDVPEDVRKIPMPRDTPPPIPKDVMDKWYAKRRARREAENAAKRERDGEESVPQNKAPAVESKTVYEAKPIMRNLRQEAVSAFVPTAVQMKLNKGQGAGGLLEPEEADQLEQEGYLRLSTTTTQSQSRPQTQGESSRKVTVEEADDEEED